jgi:hypothetical protein
MHLMGTEFCMRLIGMRLMAMHLVSISWACISCVGLTGIYLIPRTGQHLVPPRRFLDGKAPYPWAKALSFRQSVTREDTLQIREVGP